MTGDVTPKATVRRVVSAWNTGDPGFVHRCYAAALAFRRSSGAVTDRASYREGVDEEHHRGDRGLFEQLGAGPGDY